MTRFARAKGSKASNEKAPEDGTPWEVMKQQLLQAKSDKESAKKREEVEQQRIENYQNFLKDQKIQKRKATWCDFPESADIVKKSKPDKNHITKTPHIEKRTGSGEESPKDTSTNKKKNKPETSVEKPAAASFPTGVSGDNNITPKDTSKLKKKKKVKKALSEDNNKEVNSEQLNTSESSKINSNVFQNGFNNNKEQDKKKKKGRNEKKTRRKPIDDNSFRLIINGKDVDLVRYDGFPIMKKDADRLTELRKEMLRKGIPKSEVQRNMKLERRRAEKALARLKRDVCYNCRKGGHNLSDCPDLKSKIPGVDAADGLCFKCGSTEHRQFECKVQRDKEFRFASCFICKEQGHIARQCPDNPKGLYPNGGSCKLCGDVTHLRKDCPTVQDKREEKSVKLHTLSNADTLEGIPENIQPAPLQPATKKPKKISF